MSTVKRFSLRMVLPIILGLVIPSTRVKAQHDPVAPLRVEAVGSVLWLSLHDGELHDAGNAAWGFNGAVAFRQGERFGGEVFLGFTPSHREAHKPTPQLLSPGAWLTLNLTPEPGENLDLFLAAGAAWVHVSDWPDLSGCTEPDCFSTDRTDFKSGGALSFVFGSGIRYGLPGPFSLRLHIRMPSRSKVLGERVVQVGGGVGIRVR